MVLKSGILAWAKSPKSVEVTAIFGSSQDLRCFLKLAFFWAVDSCIPHVQSLSVYLLSCSHNDDTVRRVVSLPPGGRDARRDLAFLSFCPSVSLPRDDT